ncbi:hypothetical protein V1294_002374 [Bradyrhizobium sp. AZCC 1678]
MHGYSHATLPRHGERMLPEARINQNCPQPAGRKVVWKKGDVIGVKFV